MSTETEILSEVEVLKAKFGDTRALYREVCALLFFRYGITPTANKLYQYVRRGSMNVPTEEVGKFWDDLRHRARVDIGVISVFKETSTKVLDGCRPRPSRPVSWHPFSE